jgi:hypothetical protein
MDRVRESRRGVGTVGSLSRRRRSGKQKACGKKEFFAGCETFVWVVCLGGSMRNVDFRIYRVILYLILGQRSCDPSVASLIFLISPLFGAKPVQGNPAKIYRLNHQNCRVRGKQMAVRHGAYIKKRMPGH